MASRSTVRTVDLGTLGPVENEYGSFQVTENRVAYLKQVHQIVLDAGFGESLLYTAHGGDVLDKGSISGLLAAVDYGTGDSAGRWRCSKSLAWCAYLRH